MNYNHLGKTYIKLEKWQRLKKVFTFVLLILLFVFVFFRWTGFISNTPLSWKRPDVSIIDNDVSAIEQKNDQLWVNVNYNKNHSNIKNATIYVDDNIGTQELVEGNNTYIFNNLESGIHTITYKLEWSLFGSTSESINFEMFNVSTITYDVSKDIVRDEEEVRANIKQSGEFLEYNGVSTAGLYYFNSDVFSKTVNEGFDYKTITRNSLIDIINNQEIFIKQKTLMEGMNDITISEVIVDKEGNTEILKDNTQKRYTIIPAGLVSFEGITYLVISLPFYAYTYGIPEILYFSSYGNKDGDIRIDNLQWRQNNYDKSGNSFMQIELFNDISSETPVLRDIVELSDFLRNGYVYKKILRNDAYFEIPSSLDENIHWKVSLQIKYGYQNNEIPSLDDDAPKMSNSLTLYSSYNSPSIQDSIDNDFSYYPPKYIYNVEKDGYINNASILWSTAYWIDVPDIKSLISLETKTIVDGVESDWEDYDDIQNLRYNKLAGSSSIDNLTIENNSVINGNEINLNEDTLSLRLRVETPIYDWWNKLEGYDIKYIYLPNIV